MSNCRKEVIQFWRFFGELVRLQRFITSELSLWQSHRDFTIPHWQRSAERSFQRTLNHQLGTRNQESRLARGRITVHDDHDRKTVLSFDKEDR